MARECATPAKMLNQEGGPGGMWSNPLQQQSVSSQHSLSGPIPKLTQVKAVNKKGQKGIALIPFLNPDPVVCKVTALIDLGAEVSNISAKLCKDLDLKIQPLGQLLELEGPGGAAIPYLRFVEVNLQIPGIRGYNEDVLLLAIPATA